MNSSSTPQEFTLNNLLSLIRGLRELGFPIGPDEAANAVSALWWIDIGQEQSVKAALRCALVQNREEWEVFDLAWQQFRLLLTRGGDIVLADQTLLANVAKLRQQRTTRPQVVWMGRTQAQARDESVTDEGEQQALTVTLGASRQERLRQTDFAQLTRAEQDEVGHLAQAVAPLQRTSRRRQACRRGDELDLASIVARAVRGGEAFALPRTKQRTRQRPVLFLCDVSGSMDPYSRMLIRFAYTLMQRGVDIETFVFSTRLTRITTALQRRDPDTALAEVAALTPDFSGGTRLAAALFEFCQASMKHWLRRGAIVMLATDGLDTGDVERLERSAGEVSRYARRFLWLNPAADQAGYTAAARGAAVLGKFADSVVPAARWSALEQLWLSLQEQAGRHRSVRAGP